jgi:hypothetical protein
MRELRRRAPRGDERVGRGRSPAFFNATRPRFPTLVKSEVKRSKNRDLVVINTAHMNESVW